MTMDNLATIMVVDDVAESLALMEQVLAGPGRRVRTFLDGDRALAAARAEPPHVILLDVSMPGMDGFEVCRRLKAEPVLRDIPVIFISAYQDSVEKVKGFGLGGVDFVTKPFSIDEIRARVEMHLKLGLYQQALARYTARLQEMVDAQVREIAEAQMATIFALSKLAEARDFSTGQHLERVRVLCRLLAEELRRHSPYAEEMTPTFISNIYHASPLHDIGKVAIADHILQKHGDLQPDEFESMKLHTAFGAQTLEEVQAAYPGNEFIEIGISIARHHHERWDGAGYPEGLAGEEIPLAARIMALVDIYDAIRSRRVYKPALPHQHCCDFLRQARGTHLDPVIVDAYFAIEQEFERVWDEMAD